MLATTVKVSNAEMPSREVGGAVTCSHAFVVPAYGCSPFLGECLRSLQNQSLRSRVVVSTSTPSRYIDSLALANGAEVVVNPVCGGIASDWNFALGVTGARYVTLAHQDDVYSVDFLSKTLAAFARHSGSLCFTSQRQIDDEGRPCTSKISITKNVLARMTVYDRVPLSAFQMRAFLALGNPLPCSSVTFDRHRLFNFSFSSEYESNLDWDAWWRLIDQGEVFLSISAPLVSRRHNGQTATASLIASGRRRVEDLMMFRRIWPRGIADAVAAVYRLGY